MTTPITGVSTPTTAAGNDAMSKLSGNFQTFLTLLTSQLKNQDPTSPMDSNQFTQQLVMYSQVEQQIDTNTHLKNLLAQGASQAATFATAYLGKTVSVTSGQASLADGAANWTYTLGSPASITALTVTNASGQVVFTGAGETGSGAHEFTWNGKDNNGNTVPDGSYRLNVAAADASGTSVTAAVASAGRVSQIDMTSGTPLLVIGNMEVGVADVAAIGN